MAIYLPTTTHQLKSSHKFFLKLFADIFFAHCISKCIFIYACSLDCTYSNSAIIFLLVVAQRILNMQVIESKAPTASFVDPAIVSKSIAVKSQPNEAFQKNLPNHSGQPKIVES